MILLWLYLDASLFFSFRDRGRAVSGNSLTGVRSLITLLSFRSSLPIWRSFRGFGVRSSTSVRRDFFSVYFPKQFRQTLALTTSGLKEIYSWCAVIIIYNIRWTVNVSPWCSPFFWYMLLGSVSLSHSEGFSMRSCLDGMSCSLYSQKYLRFPLFLEIPAVRPLTSSTISVSHPVWKIGW